MTHKSLKQQIHILRTVGPTQATLDTIKEHVYKHVGKSERFGFPLVWKMPVISYTGLLVVTVFIVLLFLGLRGQLRSILLYGQLTFAPNQYVRAQIALTDTTSRFGKNLSTKPPVSELALSLALTDAQLNALTLQGKKGAYTALQCHHIYQAYLTYLEEVGKNITTTHDTSLRELLPQVISYEEHAEKKLHKYTSL